MRMKQFFFTIAAAMLLTACGNSFITNTKEGVEMAFVVNDKVEKNCEVGTGGTRMAAIGNYRGHITIPSSANDYFVNGVGDYAFYGCEGLTSVTIPASIERLGDEAFANCEKLNDVTIPSRVKTIGYGVFMGCKNLKSVKVRCKMVPNRP